MNFPQLYRAPDTGAATADADADADAEGDASTESSDTSNTGDAADQDWSLDTLQETTVFEEDVEEVGGNLGRNDSPDDQATDEAESSEADTDADDSTAEEDEESADEDELDPAEKVTEELMGEATGDGEAADESEGEATGDDAPDADDEDAGEKLPSDLVDDVQQHFPNRTVETREEFNQALEETRQHEEMLFQLDQMVEQDPRLEQYLQLRAQEGLEPAKAIPQAFGDALDAPDPNESPEEYAEHLAQERLRQERMQEESQQDEELEQVEQRVQDQMARQLEGFKQRMDLGDEEYTRLVSEVQRYLAGDARGNVPSDFPKRMYVALNFEDILAAEREKAREEGRREGMNDAIDQDNETRLGDGVPKPDGSSTPTDELTEREKKIRDLSESFEQESTSVDDFSL